MKKLLSLLSIVLLFACSSEDSSPSDKNLITSFQLYLNNGFVEGQIDQTNGAITFSSVGSDLNGMTPIIEYSAKATISPSENQMLNFNNVINYVVTAENGDTKPYSVIVDNRPLGSESKILSFSLNIDGTSYNCDIDNTNNLISLEVVNLDISSLTPSITISDYATISPDPTSVQNFNNSVSYSVTAENGSATSYQTNITSRPLSDENEILSFNVSLNGQSYNAQINNDNTIILNVGEENITSLSPSITISEYATISPESGTVQDFSQPVEYVVTAENGETSTYTVYTNEMGIYGLFPKFGANYIYYTGATLKISGPYINPNAANAQFLLIDGIVEYQLDASNFTSTISNGALWYTISATIPDTVLSSINYRLVYRTNNGEVEFNSDLDIQSNGPSNVSVNQSTYIYNDIFVMTGTNLVPGLVVPSNGNYYIIEFSNNYDIQVNNDSTVLTWTMNYYQHFPSYYGAAPELKRIYTLGPNRRVGVAVDVTLD